MKMWALGMATVFSAAVAGNSFGETLGVNFISSPGATGTTYSPGISSGLTVTANLGGGNSASYNRAGAFRWNVTSDTNPQTFGSYVDTNPSNGYPPLFTFCIQLFQGVGSPYYVVPLSSGLPYGGADVGSIDLLAAQQLQGLVDAHWTSIDYNGSSESNNVAGYTDNQVAAAFGLSVWEIEYDGGTGGADTFANGSNTNYFDDGIFKAYTSGSSSDKANAQAAINLANSWLNGLVLDTSLNSLVLKSNGLQDQLYGIPTPSNGGTQPVPLPASLPAGLSLMAGLAIVRKIRKSRA